MKYEIKASGHQIFIVDKKGTIYYIFYHLENARKYIKKLSNKDVLNGK